MLEGPCKSIGREINSNVRLWGRGNGVLEELECSRTETGKRVASLEGKARTYQGQKGMLYYVSIGIYSR